MDSDGWVIHLRFKRLRDACSEKGMRMDEYERYFFDLNGTWLWRMP